MIWSIFSSASEYPNAILGDEEGFVDVSLSISKYETLNNGTKRFLIRNTLNGLKVSFIVELLPKWDAKPIENTNAIFYWGNANIISVGAESDVFLTQIAALYGIESAEKLLKKNISAQVVGLANDPKSIESIPIKMKFFLSPDEDENLYSEVFINIDLKNKVLEFNEKDPEYRLPLVRSMAQ